MTLAPIDRPEFRLLCDCCRWNFRANGGEPPKIPVPLNWSRFVELARLHRVQGLAWNALTENVDHLLPPDAIEALSADARAIAATNLAVARECGALTETFASSKIALLFVKGLSVAALTYRSPFLKMASDIDILIDPADLAAAAEILSARGFQLKIPGTAGRLQLWHSRRKESVWSRADGLHIELHTRLADNAALIPTLSVHSPSELVEVAPGISLRTLALEELFAYLCVHGASSAWFRLKWISDLAGLVAARSCAEIERLYDRAQELGAERAAAQALLIANRLFGTPSPAFTTDRAIRMLANAALRQLAQTREPTENVLGTFRIHWTQLLLKPGLAYGLGELRRQVRDAVS